MPSSGGKNGSLEAPLLENPVDTPDNTPSYSSISVVVLSAITCVDAIEYGLIMPSLWKCLLKVNGPTTDTSYLTHTYGLVKCT